MGRRKKDKAEKARAKVRRDAAGYPKLTDRQLEMLRMFRLLTDIGIDDYQPLVELGLIKPDWEQDPRITQEGRDLLTHLGDDVPEVEEEPQMSEAEVVAAVHPNVLDTGSLIDGPFIPDGECRIYDPDSHAILGWGDTPQEAYRSYKIRQGL